MQGIAIVAGDGRARQPHARAWKKMPPREVAAATHSGQSRLRGSLPRRAAFVFPDVRRQETVARRLQAAMTSGRADLRHCNPSRGPRILGSAPDGSLEENAMRCLHHVFLRGGLALLLLASAGVGAFALPVHACVTSAHVAVAPTAAHARC